MRFQQTRGFRNMVVIVLSISFIFGLSILSPLSVAYAADVPVISSLSKTTARAGESLVITGSGFTATDNIVYITPNDKVASLTSNGQTISFTLPLSLSSNGHYVYVVNANGTSNKLVVVITGDPDTQAPSTPTNLKVDSVGSSNVDLSWTASTDNVGLAGYRIYRDGLLTDTAGPTSWGEGLLSPERTYTYKVSAVDAAGNESATSNVINVITKSIGTTSAPVIVSFFSSNATGSNAPIKSGETASLIAKVTGTPTPTVSVNNGVGVVSGIGSTFSFNVSPTVTTTYILTATNSAGIVTSSLTVTVIPASATTPAITSPLTAKAKMGVPFSYQITANNSPTSFDASLPDVKNSLFLHGGLSVDPKSGIISGTPDFFGNFTIDLTATSSSSTVSNKLALTILPNPNIPVITSSLEARAFAGEPFSYQITATNNPTSFEIEFFSNETFRNNLPVNSAGLISAIPFQNENISVFVKVSNASGTGRARLVFWIKDREQSIPVMTSPASAVGFVGQPFSYQFTGIDTPKGTQSPLFIDNVTNLPLGLTFDSSTKIISGSSKTAGVNIVGVGSSFLKIIIFDTETSNLSDPAMSPLRDGALINDRGTIFVIENSLKRGFTSLEVFKESGRKLSSVVEADTANVPAGEVISDATQRHPRGTLVIFEGTIYFLGKDLRYPFPSEEVFLSWGHSFANVVPANSADMNSPVGPIVELKK